MALHGFRKGENRAGKSVSHSFTATITCDEEGCRSIASSVRGGSTGLHVKPHSWMTLVSEMAMATVLLLSGRKVMVVTLLESQPRDLTILSDRE